MLGRNGTGQTAWRERQDLGERGSQQPVAENDQSTCAYPSYMYGSILELGWLVSQAYDNPWEDADFDVKVPIPVLLEHIRWRDILPL